MSKIVKYKPRNKFIFRTCSFISLWSFKLSQFIEKKISLFCANKAEKREVIEEVKEREEVEKTYELGEKVKEHKEEIINTYNNLYFSLEDCEKENEVLATKMIELFVAFKEKDYEKMESIFKELNMEEVLKIRYNNN